MLDIPAPSNPKRVWLLAMPVFLCVFSRPGQFWSDNNHEVCRLILQCVIRSLNESKMDNERNSDAQ